MSLAAGIAFGVGNIVAPLWFMLMHRFKHFVVTSSTLMWSHNIACAIAFGVIVQNLSFVSPFLAQGGCMFCLWFLCLVEECSYSEYNTPALQNTVNNNFVVPLKDAFGVPQESFYKEKAVRDRKLSVWGLRGTITFANVFTGVYYILCVNNLDYRNFMFGQTSGFIVSTNQISAYDPSYLISGILLIISSGFMFFSYLGEGVIKGNNVSVGSIFAGLAYPTWLAAGVFITTTNIILYSPLGVDFDDTLIYGVAIATVTGAFVLVFIVFALLLHTCSCCNRCVEGGCGLTIGDLIDKEDDDDDTIFIIGRNAKWAAKMFVLLTLIVGTASGAYWVMKWMDKKSKEGKEDGDVPKANAISAETQELLDRVEKGNIPKEVFNGSRGLRPHRNGTIGLETTGKPGRGFRSNALTQTSM
jgi:hypothetical protein